MRRFNNSVRITLALSAISLGVISVASLLGLFAPAALHDEAAWAWLPSPQHRGLLFFCVTTLLAFQIYLQQTLVVIDPAKTVPQRVHSALNTLAEGVIILDEDEQIVLANATFVKIFQKTEDELFGLKASYLGWIPAPDNEQLILPWLSSLRHGTAHQDVPIALPVPGNEPKIYRVNSTPIIDDRGQRTGAMATFNDVTTIERNRYALRKILNELCISRDEIKRQNSELQVLATRDPLTNCLNRRSFFEQFETQWRNAQRYQFPLSCIMIDLDHFKDVNDTFGHATGDQVLQVVSHVLQKTARDTDIVCRYGGEEFCILLTHTPLEQALEAAERFHKAIAMCKFTQLKMTASLGVAEMHAELADPQALINEADKCLYLAKRYGRNQILGSQQVSPEVLARELPCTPEKASAEEKRVSIPFHAVTALFSALTYRDVTTAEHSRRVADLCVAVGSGLLSNSDLYMLEVAALLHDIGKIGVPDAILLKPDALDEEERRVMSSHSRIGVEILHSAFSCPKLTETVRMHDLWYAGDVDFEHLPSGEEIPLTARLLTIADAFDSMTSDHSYRIGRTPAAAFQELRRFAGNQFDSELVEYFIRVVSDCELGQSRQIGCISKQTALQFGLEIERLAQLIDSHDFSGMKTLAGRLKVTAHKHGVKAIASTAAALEAALAAESTLDSLLPLIQELLELCRQTQHVFLRTELSPAVPVIAAI